MGKPKSNGSVRQELLFIYLLCLSFFFFFQAEDGIRDLTVTGVQTCALPIYWAMSSGWVLGTTSTCSWLPLRCWRSSACCTSACFCAASSVPVVSTTGESSAGIGASCCACDASGSHSSRASSAVARRIGQWPGCGAGCCGALPKSTAGALEICASLSTVKFGLVL